MMYPYLTLDVLHILREVCTIVGVKVWFTPEHQTSIKRYLPVITALYQAATITEA